MAVHHWLLVAVAGISIGLGGARAAAQQPESKPAAAKTAAKDTSLKALIRARIDSAMKVLEDGGDFKKAETELRQGWDLAAAWAPSDQGDVFVDADAALRLVVQLQQVKDAGTQKSLFALLHKSPQLERELVFAVTPQDKVPAVYGVLAALQAKLGDRIGAYPSLTSALCVVYDTPRNARRTEEPKKPEKIDPVALFAYFTAHEQKLQFGLNTLPTDLMIYLVYTTAAPDELEWAFRTYDGDRNVGKRYFDLTYDTASFKFNKPKKIASVPYTLENLRKVGGVCEEQAYFASHVARAIGVPGVYIFGQSADVAHAWVGFLQDRGGTVVWNMDEGHYDDYEKILGSVNDPQTGHKISDNELAMSAETLAVPGPTRYAAAAFVDAARLLSQERKEWPPKLPEGITSTLSTPRPTGKEGALLMLRAAVTVGPNLPDVWNAVKWGAENGLISGAARQDLFDVLSSHCGKKYAGFGYGVTAALIATIDDPAEQSRAWDWAFQTFRMRPDLAADARIHQGDLWKKAGDQGRAYEAFLDVVKQFPNEGVFVVTALDRAEKMLTEAKKDAAVVEMYKDAWRRIARPSSTSANAFRQSNFYRVGERYAKALEKMGQTVEAGNVRRQIDRGVEKTGSGFRDFPTGP